MVGPIWRLGSVAASVPGRIQVLSDGALAEEMGFLYQRNLGTIRFARAYRKGFRPIADYHEEDLYSGAIVEDFAFRDWRFRAERAVMREALVAQATGDPERLARAQERLDFLDHEGRRIWQHTCRGRRGLVVPGLKDAAA